MLKHENTDVCRTWSTADAGVFCWGEVAEAYRLAALSKNPRRMSQEAVNLA